jgi:hypothetical protein
VLSVFSAKCCGDKKSKKSPLKGGEGILRLVLFTNEMKISKKRNILCWGFIQQQETFSGVSFIINEILRYTQE